MGICLKPLDKEVYILTLVLDTVFLFKMLNLMPTLLVYSVPRFKVYILLFSFFGWGKREDEWTIHGVPETERS